ncbi:MAG: diadenylate cyclase CdaA [Firmicutes bacterium]|nr:diadenylate cyclase CdaA [Bacillota bacterium]
MEFFQSLFSNVGVFNYGLPKIGVIDILDIAIVAYVIYKIIFWIKETRAWTLFKGILFILLFALVAMVLHLNTITWILSNAISVGIIAVVVVFQPELRKALEQLGKTRHIFDILDLSASTNIGGMSEKAVDEVVRACEKMSAVKTGALILIEREVPLGDLERTGISIDAVVTNQLLVNIFEKNTPLHDGAVIIKNNRVAAATCFLPLTDSNDVSKDLGTRHRAGIGASEVSDADVVIVSEETGAISLARGGVLYRRLTPETLKSMLYQETKIKKRHSIKNIKIWKGWKNNE